ncbi:MAG: HD domain-containing protein [Spirochaetales bacterium]|nr:HD domain-containing protein [Spirochaetales bacterium]
MIEQLAILKQKGFSFLLSSYSALDRYFKIEEPGALYINTDATLVTLAKEFENLTYPGFPFADAHLLYGNTCVFLRCVDNTAMPFPEPFTAMNLLYNATRKVFLDPLNIYRDIRQHNLILNMSASPPDIVLMEAAKLISRYHYEIGNRERVQELPFSYHLSKEMQQHLLVSILSSQYPWKGLGLLQSSGFIERYWPEMYRMCEVKHAKDYHPEGNVWEHTLETFKYRKKVDLTLSLALLLHDIGKPVAKKTTTKPFHEHSELGTRIARRFLARLGFSEEMQQNVAYLIRFHMIPWALKRLPLYRTEKLMDSPLFPILLELYRADISSTFRGPESYYDACRVYRNYLKSKKNTYKTIKGM